MTKKTVVTSIHEPTLADLCRDVWAARLYVFLGSLAGFILALCILITAIPHHKAEMIISPPDRKTGLDTRNLLPDNTNFAVQYIADSLGGQGLTDFVKFQQILKGGTIAKVLIEDPLILNHLGKHKRWMFKSSIAFKPDEDKNQAIQKLSKYLRDHIKIEPVGNSSSKRLVYFHPDPVFATYMLNTLYEHADDIIQSRAYNQTTKRAQFLKNTLSQTSNPDHRQALAALLIEQEYLTMLLTLDESFAAQMVEPALSSYKALWPNAYMIICGFLFCGGLIGFVVFHLRKNKVTG